MKRLLVLLVLVAAFICVQAQQSTRKWNDFQKRYEYFDSKGKMTGYSEWNSFKKQWEYFENKNYRQPNTANPPTTYEWKNPYDMDLIEKGLSIKQQQYQTKKQSIQSWINIIDQEFKYLDNEIGIENLTEDQANRIVKYYDFINSLTNWDVNDNYNNLVKYFRDAYNTVRSWRK